MDSKEKLKELNVLNAIMLVAILIGIVIGIIMIWVCAKSHHSGGGGEYMYMRGWLAAIVSLIYGTLKVLGML